MRIRKRLPPSSSPSEGLSDLLLLHRSAPPPPSDRSSDRSTAICSKNKKWDFPQHDKNQEQKEFEEINEAWAVEETKKKNANNDIRKIVSICHDREDTKKVMLPSSSSTQESLCEEDYKVVPPKKRKGSFERNPNEESPSLMGAKMKSKTNKKCGDQKPPKMEEQKHGININICPNGGVKKCKIRGNVIMEGSRCSRINGRGWRCRQPTMVGYSLCEHHLGKGRLRSIANTVRRGGNVAAGGDAPPPSGGDSPLMVRKKRTKVGVVKARSMSSLLSQI